MTDHNPYQAPTNHYDEFDDTEYEYAGFWIRFLAHIIDSLIMTPIFVVLGVIAAMTGVPLEESSVGILDLVVLVLTFVFYIGCWVKFAGTPGKRILKLKILDADTGENLTAGKALIRYLMYLVSYLLLCIGLIWAAFDKKKQGWHDKVANSVVVKEL